MSLDSNLNINITIGGPNISRASFQQVAFVADFGFSERTRTYVSADQVDTDETNGDLTADEAAKMRAFFSQSRHTDELIAGRREDSQAQVDEFTVDSVGSASQSDTAEIEVNGSDAEHSLASSPTTDTVASGLESAINSLSEPVTATSSGSTVTITADTAGEPFTLAVGPDNNGEINYVKTDEFTVDSIGSAEQDDVAAIDVSGDEATHTLGNSPTTDSVASGLASTIDSLTSKLSTSTSSSTVTITQSDISEKLKTEVGASNNSEITYTITTNAENISIRTELDKIESSNSSWYAFTIDSEDNGDIEQAAEWTEPKQHQFWPQSSSNDLRDNNSGNIGETIRDNNYTRTAVPLYHPDSAEPFALCFLGDLFGVDPDNNSTTTAYKTLETIASVDISGQDKVNLDDLNASYYTTFYGSDSTQAVTMGSGDRAELVLARDWLKSRLQEDIAQLLAYQSDRGGKVPYTNSGIRTIAERVEQRLSDGEDIGHYVPRSSDVTYPDLSDISNADRRNNVLTDLEFGTQPALSIDKVDPLNGYIDVNFSGF